MVQRPDSLRRFRWPRLPDQGGLEKGELRQVKPRGPTLRFRLNPEQVTESGGVGGWGRRQRPLRRPALEWEGIPEQTLSFTLLLDGWPDRSVEQDIRALRRMGRPRSRGRPPPELELEYGNMGRGATWVIDNLSWGDELRNRQLQRVRQEVTVSLVRYVEADITLTPTQRHKERKGKRGGGGGKKGADRNRVYVVKRGDTLSAVAARQLGRANRWPEIAELNSLRDPNRLRVGQRLRMPEA